MSAVHSLFTGTSNQLGAFWSGVAAALLGTVPAVLLGGLGTIVVAVLWMSCSPSSAVSAASKNDAAGARRRGGGRAGCGEDRRGPRGSCAAGGGWAPRAATVVAAGPGRGGGRRDPFPHAAAERLAPGWSPAAAEQRRVPRGRLDPRRAPRPVPRPPQRRHRGEALAAIIRAVNASASDRALRWVAPALLPAVNLALALLLSAVVVLLVGENPARALGLLASGAFGNAEAVGYTLYYATNFVFTGLAVAVAFHGGLFNIGAEGQAYVAGLGVALLCLGAGGWPTALVVAVGRPRGGGRRRRLGVRARLASGPARQPRRHHDDHVQLHRLGADDPPPRQRPDQAGPAVAGDARVRPQHLAAAAPRGRRAAGLGDRPLAAQPLARCSRWPPVAWSGSISGTRAGATRCGPSATTRRPPSTAAFGPRER